MDILKRSLLQTSSLGRINGESLPRETPIWLRVPSDFALGLPVNGAAKENAGTSASGPGNGAAKENAGTSASGPGNGAAKENAGTSSKAEIVCIPQRCTKQVEGRRASAEVEVLALSFFDGARLTVYSNQADMFLARFSGESLAVEYIDDAHWDKFPKVGAVLRLISRTEECFVGAYCAPQGAWAFGVGMGGYDRLASAKVALAITLALRTGPYDEELLQYPQLASLAFQAHRKRWMPKWSKFGSYLAALRNRCYAWLFTRLIGRRLRITSPCPGSTEHWAELRVNATGTTFQITAAWDGFCVCCKRPLCLSVADAPVAPLPKKRKLERRAYVCAIWGTDPQYVLGAMVLGYSLRQTGTKHDLLMMHTSDVPEAARTLLSRAGWQLRFVYYVNASKMLFSNPGNRFEGVFTKLRAFELVEYSKVLVLDSDLLVRDNIDHIFDLPAPAAMHRGIVCGYAHGEKIDGKNFFGGSRPGFDMDAASDDAWDRKVTGPWSWGQATGINAGVMLFRPDLELLHQCLSEVVDGAHPEHIRGGGPEQDYLSRFFASDWTHINVSYNFQLHQMYFMLGGMGVPGMPNADRGDFLRRPDLIKVFHYSGTKPWMRHLDSRYANTSESDWLREVLEGFEGYRAFVLKDPESANVDKGGDVPAWAIEAAEKLISLALRDWDAAYNALANEMREPQLGHAVIAASGEWWHLSKAAWSEIQPSSKDNPIWDRLWSQLSVEQCSAAQSLGWSVETWDTFVWMVPKAVAWSDLPSETRNALEVLGESAEAWDRWTSNQPWF